MNIAASSVLSRTDDFQPSFRSEPSLISSGIEYGMPPARAFPDINGARAESADGRFIFERTLLRRLAKTLTSYLGFIAAALSEEDAPKTRTIITNVAFSAAPPSETEQIFDATQALYLSSNNPRDRQIADTTLRHIATEEEQHMLPSSITQMAAFFLNHPSLALPKITLTPDGTLRAHWMKGPRNFVRIEFTGSPTARLVAEIPDDNNFTATSTYFSSQPLKSVVAAAKRLGASFK